MSIQTRRRTSRGRRFTAILSISIEPDMKARIEKVADLEDVPVSAVARDALNIGMPKVEARQAERAARRREAEGRLAIETARDALSAKAPTEFAAYVEARAAMDKAEAKADAALDAAADASDAAADAAMDKADATLAKAKARAEASINALKAAAPDEYAAYETARAEAE